MWQLFWVRDTGENFLLARCCLWDLPHFFFWCGQGRCPTSLTPHYHTEKKIKHSYVHVDIFKKIGNSSCFLLSLFAFSVGFTMFLFFPVLALYPLILWPSFVRGLFGVCLFVSKLQSFLTENLSQKCLINTKIRCILFWLLNKFWKTYAVE